MAVRFGSTGFFALCLVEVASIISIVGCADPQLRLSADAEPPGTSYRSAYSRWTRDGSVVSLHSFDTMLLVSATLRSRSFQRAYIDRYIKTYKITDPAERARIEKQELDLAESGLNFWVRTASHDSKWNDLTPQRGQWRVALYFDPPSPQMAKTEVLPEEITPVSRSQGQILETSLLGEEPDAFRRIWHLRFPPLGQGAGSSPAATPQDAPRKLTLRFAGPEGKLDLVWRVE